MTNEVDGAENEAIETDERPANQAWKDILERTAWTVLQGVSATAIVAWYQVQDWPDLPTWAVVPVVGLLAGALAAIKGKLATRFGNGTASSLKGAAEPVLPERVVAQETGSGIVVAGEALTPGGNVDAGTPVDIYVPEHADPDVADDPAELPDQGDVVNEDLEMPEDFDDGTGPVDTSKLG